MVIKNRGSSIRRKLFEASSQAKRPRPLVTEMKFLISRVSVDRFFLAALRLVGRRRSQGRAPSFYYPDNRL